MNKAIQQLDQVIQQNASASEEMASTAQELSGQAAVLQGAIAYFNGEESGRGELAPATGVTTRRTPRQGAGAGAAATYSAAASLAHMSRAMRSAGPAIELNPNKLESDSRDKDFAPYQA